jgi:hypothetical protein
LAVVVHSIGVPGDVPGGTQKPPVHSSADEHCALELHGSSHPFVVHARPLGQSFEPEHELTPPPPEGSEPEGAQV